LDLLGHEERVLVVLDDAGAGYEGEASRSADFDRADMNGLSNYWVRHLFGIQASAFTGVQ
jgi:hypothetical protein